MRAWPNLACLYPDGRAPPACLCWNESGTLVGGNVNGSTTESGNLKDTIFKILRIRLPAEISITLSSISNDTLE